MISNILFHLLTSLYHLSTLKTNPYNPLSWLNQPIWKICSSNWIISPGVGIWGQSKFQMWSSSHSDLPDLSWKTQLLKCQPKNTPSYNPYPTGSMYQVLPSDLFGCFKWPFQGLSDLHLKFGWSKGHLEEAGTYICFLVPGIISRENLGDSQYIPSHKDPKFCSPFGLHFLSQALNVWHISLYTFIYHHLPLP